MAVILASRFDVTKHVIFIVLILCPALEANKKKLSTPNPNPNAAYPLV